MLILRLFLSGEILKYVLKSYGSYIVADYMFAHLLNEPLNP